MPAPYWLHESLLEFPPAALAADDPPGLLAVGGDLRPERLLAAYAGGIFPWFSDESPILWWSPDPRMVLRPQDVHISHSMRRLIRQQRFAEAPLRLTMDRDFEAVTALCASQRERREGTWITSSMQQAYLELHKMGHAHSLEVWQADALVGGLYGVSLGQMFFGESMVSLAPNVSKLAFIGLCLQLREWQFRLIDCQLPTAHLSSLGAREMSREHFLAELAVGRQASPALAPGPGWSFNDMLLAVL